MDSGPNANSENRIRRRCGLCGDFYVARRVTSKYCSDKCRLAAHRANTYSCWSCGDQVNPGDQVGTWTIPAGKARDNIVSPDVDVCAECHGIFGESLRTPNLPMSTHLEFLLRQVTLRHRPTEENFDWSNDPLLLEIGLDETLRAVMRKRQAARQRHKLRYDFINARLGQVQQYERKS